MNLVFCEDKVVLTNIIQVFKCDILISFFPRPGEQLCVCVGGVIDMNADC